MRLAGQDWVFIWTTTTPGDANRFNIHWGGDQFCVDYREPNGAIHGLGCSAGGTVPAGQWSFIAFVKQGNVYSYYVNSSATGNVTTLTSQVTDTAPNLPTTTSWTINGRCALNGQSCSVGGLLDEIRVSNKALSPSEFLVGSALQVSPATDIAASGIQGQLSSPASFNYQLSSATGSVHYSISGIPSWLTPNFTTGTVPPTVTDTFSVNACGFGPGTYPATITFANAGGGPGTTTRNATLTVNPGTKDDCKDGGWQKFTCAPGPFTNQGQCVSYFARQ